MGGRCLQGIRREGSAWGPGTSPEATTTGNHYR